jgi:hypothetical protein
MHFNFDPKINKLTDKENKESFKISDFWNRKYLCKESFILGYIKKLIVVHLHFLMLNEMEMHIIGTN